MHDMAEMTNPVGFTTSLHYYKRNLSPIKESFALCNEKTPYHSNFENFQGKLISNNFKKEMLSRLESQFHGTSSVRCVTSQNLLRRPDRIMQTFIAVESR